MPVSFSSFNKSQGRIFDLDTKDYAYCNLQDLYTADGDGVVYTVNAMWLNNSEFGVQPIFAIADRKLKVNMPSHLCDTVRQILADSDAVAGIKSGKCGMTVYAYAHPKYRRTCYGVRFVDV